MAIEPPFSRDPRYRIVALYLLLGIGWILFSDNLMLLLFQDPKQLTLMQTYKGWGYVLLTAALLFALMGRYRRQDLQRLAVLREQDERLQLAQNMAGIGVWELRLKDRQSLWSEQVAALYGIAPGSFDGSLQSWLRMIHPEDRAEVAARIDEATSQPRPFCLEFRIQHASGETRWLLSQGNVIRDIQGRPEHLLGISMDITARKQTEEHLQQADAVYRSSRDGIIITDPEARIVSANPAALEICGYSEQDILGQNPSLFKSGRHNRSFYQQMWSAILRHGGWAGEVWNRRKDGGLYPAWLSISSVRDQQGRLINYAGVITDLTHQKLSEAEVEYLATHDPLTELPNRRLFDTRLSFAIEQAQRHQSGLAVLLVDLDGFKDINDSYGLTAGDSLLQEMAQRVEHAVGQAGTVARHSGDELLVLLEEMNDPQQVAVVAEGIHEALRSPYEVNESRCFLTACIGICLFPENGDAPELLIRNADTAVHRAKEQGRDRTEFYSESLSHSALQRLSMNSGLRHALEQQELELHYQPQLTLSRRQLVGVEALVRWRHPEQGLIPPDKFIPLAEQSGLIQAIGEWVLEEACRQMAAWRQAGIAIPRVAVNVSAHQLGRTDLIESITRTLNRHGLAVNQLEIELTETAIMRNPERAAKTLEAMADHGIALAVDDFGTGYSSLSYLQRLRLHRVKIDRSFTHDLPDNPNNAAICHAIIAMANSLGMETIAEGVETAAQCDFLSGANCLIGQGWLFARAMPAQDLADWLADHAAG